MAKDTQNRFVSPKAWERIEQWSRRKPVFALMGEFSAGKSTLMNFLLRTHTLPTQVTATQLPPVWFSWGNQSAYVKRHDGSTDLIDLDQLESVGVNDAQFIRIFLEADILEAVDLIDTPGISDPKISTDVWQRAVGQANGVLWCTHATQAWRETERATWVSLPERLQHNSLLLVTRADALGQKDRQKVLRRVNREAGHLFNRSILFSARDAIEARDKTGDAEMWSRSGGGKMIDSFLEITENIMDNRADQLARYQIDKGLSDEPKVQPLRPSRNTEAPAVTRPDAETPAPLKLVNPVDEADGDTSVVTSFPVRPARVERRAEEDERPRIDSAEADRLRAEMTPESEDLPQNSETKEDELRAYFRDTAKDPMEFDAVSDQTSEIDDYDLLDDEDTDDEVENILIVSDAEVGSSDATDESESDDVLTSLSTALHETQDTSEETEVEQPPEAEGHVSEATTSSIAALMAEQHEAASDEYEPEPETHGLVELSSATAPQETAEPQVVELDALSEDHPGTSLSALAMWTEVTKNEVLPDDPRELMRVFHAFLKEFDQISSEHSEKQTNEALRSIPKSKENSGMEWHVL